MVPSTPFLDSSSESSEDNEDWEENPMCREDGEIPFSGDDGEGGFTHGDWNSTGGDAMIDGAENETPEAAEVENEAHTFDILKDQTRMISMGEREGKCVITSITINSNVNGVSDTMVLTDRNSVYLTFKDGKLFCNPSPPISKNDPTLSLDPNVEPTLALPNLVDPNPHCLLFEPSLTPPVHDGAKSPSSLAQPCVNNDTLSSPSLEVQPDPVSCTMAVATPSPPLSSTHPCDPLQLSDAPQIPLVVDLPPIPPSSSLLLSGSEDGVCPSNLVVANNSSIWADKSMSKAEKIWKVAKAVGVSGVGNESNYIQKITEMEIRDKAEFGLKGTSKRNK